MNAMIVKHDELNKHLSEFQSIQLLITRTEKANAKLNALSECKTAADSLVSAIREWRRAAIEGSINSICEEANIFLAGMGYEQLKIELSEGKRSSVSVSTVGGVNVTAMCGCERVIYSTALLHAIQTHREVNLPLMFIEASELDAANLNRLVETCDKVRSSGNVIIAHYLPTTYQSDEVEVIDVHEETFACMTV